MGTIADANTLQRHSLTRRQSCASAGAGSRAGPSVGAVADFPEMEELRDIGGEGRLPIAHALPAPHENDIHVPIPPSVIPPIARAIEHPHGVEQRRMVARRQNDHGCAFGRRHRASQDGRRRKRASARRIRCARAEACFSDKSRDVCGRATCSPPPRMRRRGGPAGETPGMRDADVLRSIGASETQTLTFAWRMTVDGRGVHQTLRWGATLRQNRICAGSRRPA
jgi:hypothetical protein